MWWMRSGGCSFERVCALGEVAVMYRTNAQSRVLEEVFIAKDMPYLLVRGTRFYDRKEIKDVLAYLRLIHNPDDSVSLGRIINVPARSIGAKTIADLNRWAFELGCDPLAGHAAAGGRGGAERS